MIDRDHPAVEAGAEGMEYPHTPTAHDAIVAALPHLESATPENLARLRDTPAGRALMAEAWEEGAEAGERDYVTALDPDHKCIPNPYREDDA